MSQCVANFRPRRSSKLNIVLALLFPGHILSDQVGLLPTVATTTTLVKVFFKVHDLRYQSCSGSCVSGAIRCSENKSKTQVLPFENEDRLHRRHNPWPYQTGWSDLAYINQNRRTHLLQIE